MAALILLSSIGGILEPEYLTNFFYKIFSFLPVIILVRRATIQTIYSAVLGSFLLSTTIAIVLLVIGYSSPKFIIYDDVIPRFAGLSIEPVSYALGSVVVYIFLILRSRSASLKISAIFYLPIIAAVSGVVLIKIAIDFLEKAKFKNLIFLMLLAVLATPLLLNETRVGDSIATRLYGYTEILKKLDASFLGTGFYSNEDVKGLPGILRVYFELGPGFLFCLFFFYLGLIVKFRLYRWPFLFMGMALPFLTEAYGTPLLWLVSMFCLYRGKECLGKHVVSPQGYL